MSKWYPKDIKKNIKEEISKYEIARSELTEEESNTLADAVTAHHREQMKKQPKERREIFFDGKNHYCLLVVPEKPKSEPPRKMNKITDKEEYNFSCRFLKGSVWVSFPLHELKKAFPDKHDKWNKSVWCKGKYTEYVNIMGYTRGKYKTLEEAVEANTTEEKPINLEDLNDSDIYYSCFFSVYNVVKVEEEEEE